MARVAQQQRLEVLHTGAQEWPDLRVVARRPGRGERARRAASHRSDGSRTVRPYAQLHAPGTARRQFELPAEQSRGGQGVGGWRVGGDGRVPRGAGPPQAGVVDSGGQFGPGSA